jgi:hypothetical protein
MKKPKQYDGMILLNILIVLILGFVATMIIINQPVVMDKIGETIRGFVNAFK